MPVCRKSVRAFTRDVYVRRDPLQPVAGERLGASLSRGELLQLVSEFGTQLAGQPGMVEFQ